MCYIQFESVFYVDIIEPLSVRPSVRPLEYYPYKAGNFYISGVVIYMMRNMRNAIDLWFYFFNCN